MDPSAKKRSFSFRSAYRNDPQFSSGNLSRQGPIEEEVRFNLMIENDAAVARNYQRIASDGVEDLFVREDAGTTFGSYRDRTIGEVQGSLGRIFPDLFLSDLGNPLNDGTFKFTKGTSKDFLYKNLSGGEKAVFDLLLDFTVKARTFRDTVYCIDEPEAHLNTRVQGALLEELLRCLPEGCQLWLASHSIGMMRRARDLYEKDPAGVAFLDFNAGNFDAPVILRPVAVNRSFWEQTLSVALDDVASLVMPSRIVLCEGTPAGSPGKNASYDAMCYEAIFGNELPDTRFVSAGNCHDLQSDRLALFATLKALASGCDVLRLIDHDDHSPTDVQELERQGYRVLGRRQIESYLFDDGVLASFCASQGHPELASDVLQDKADALAGLAPQGKPPDDMKSAAGVFYTKLRQRLSLTGMGNEPRAFARNALAPLLRPGVPAYDELKTSIFG